MSEFMQELAFLELKALVRLLGDRGLLSPLSDDEIRSKIHPDESLWHDDVGSCWAVLTPLDPDNTQYGAWDYFRFDPQVGKWMPTTRTWEQLEHVLAHH